MASWTPWMVVPRSAAICEIETFMTLLSSTITNWAEARMRIASHLPTRRPPRLRTRVTWYGRVSCPFVHRAPSQDRRSATRSDPRPPGAEGRRVRVLRGAREDVRAADDLDVDEARAVHERQDLLLE